MTTGERLKFFRKKRGLSQRSLANLAGYNESLIVRLERGRIELIKIDTLCDLAGALHIPPIDLLGDDEQRRVLGGRQIF